MKIWAIVLLAGALLLGGYWVFEQRGKDASSGDGAAAPHEPIATPTESEGAGANGNADASDGEAPDESGESEKPSAQRDVKLTAAEAFGGLRFNTPVDITNAGDGSGRLFVIEKHGVIAVMSDTTDGAERSVFLDIRDRVHSNGSEQGLLGLAFHPDFAQNGLLYVNATTAQHTVISEFRATDPGQAADPNSERVLLTFSQPYSNHNGGGMAFGPDGYLYIASGDGGSGGDPHSFGQDRGSLLGKILRIDVNAKDSDRAYAIPPDNPFVGNGEGYREEIYAYGLRNPWRIGFDRDTGQLWAADVGQSAVEEVNIIEHGGNYGWSIMEGSACFANNGRCGDSELIEPIWEYRPDRGGASITGGYVYRGEQYPALAGLYVAADFVDGRVWTLQLGEDGAVREQLQELSLAGATSFGEDELGELYAALIDGRIMRIGAQ